MLFYYKGLRNDFDATLELIDGKYIVKKGSKVSKTVSEHFSSTNVVIKRRNDAGIKEDRIVPNDIEFKSSSVAGEFVSGSSCNGPSLWKTKDGKMIKDMMEK